MTLISTVGGASGPLYGTLFLGMAAAAAGKLELTLADWIAAFEAGVAGRCAGARPRSATRR